MCIRDSYRVDILTHKSDDERRQCCAETGVDLNDHCCLDMAWFCSDPVESESQGSNPVVMYIASRREYRLHISMNGNMATPIRFCPWCASELPPVLTDTWYQTLHDMGFSDPGGDDDIPAEFESDQWWKQRGL